MFRGGIPAVRQAIIDQNAARRAAGEPEVPGAALLALAEDLLPKTRSADWCDRAEAALAAGSATGMRDLRALVTQADSVAKDDASRAMSARLRDAMNGRVEGDRTAWTTEITDAIAAGKLVRALRLTTKAPDPAAKLAADVQAHLIAQTNQALSPTASSDLWAALIGAAAEAPFRRDIVPVGMPADASETLKETAAQASNRIPALLKVLGLTMPPPPRRMTPPPPPRPPARPAAPAAEAAPAPVDAIIDEAASSSVIDSIVDSADDAAPIDASAETAAAE